MRQSDSHLEQRFENLWYSVALDLPIVPQKTGVVPGRRFVYDFYCPSAKVLFEINGGTYAKGRSGHSSGKGIARDAEKVNQAQLQGYDIFVLTVDQLTKEYIETLANYCRDKCKNSLENTKHHLNGTLPIGSGQKSTTHWVQKTYTIPVRLAVVAA